MCLSIFFRLLICLVPSTFIRKSLTGETRLIDKSRRCTQDKRILGSTTDEHIHEGILRQSVLLLPPGSQSETRTSPKPIGIDRKKKKIREKT